MHYLNSWYPLETTKEMDMEAGPLGINSFAVRPTDRFYDADHVDENIKMLQEKIARLERERLPLFERKNFVSHSGLNLTWKIECDALTSEDWETLALMISEHIKFGSVEGIPNGGLKLAAALEKYKTEGSPLLIVDDVCTTGNSLEYYRDGREAIGYVVFTRDLHLLPKWCYSLFGYRVNRA